MKTTQLILITALFAGTLLLAACGTSPAQVDLAGTSWSLVSYGSSTSPTAAAAGVETNLDFNADGNVHGTMGCNGFGGEYSADGKSITFGPIMSTMMACEEPIMTQEITALHVMTGTTPFEVVGDTLTIHSADGNSVLILKRK